MSDKGQFRTCPKCGRINIQPTKCVCETVAICGDCLYPLDQCEHGREFKK